MLVSGEMERQKALEFILGKMAIAMRENGKPVGSMAKVLIYLRMEINTVACIKMGNLMAKVSTLGQMEITMKALSREV